MADGDPRHPKHSKAWRILVLLLAVPVLVAVAWFATMNTELGARTVWRILTRMPSISGEYEGGTLSSGLRLRHVQYRDAKRRIEIDRLHSQWQIRWSPLKLTVSDLAFNQLALTLLPTPPESRVLPDSLRLPLALDLKQARVQKLTLNTTDANLVFSGIVLHADSDGVHHRLVLERAGTPAGKATLQLGIDGDRPFALNGRASLSGSTPLPVRFQETYAAQVQVSGTLANISTVADMTGSRAHGRLEVAVTPFADIPFSRAMVDIRGVNLATFRDGLPKTDIAIQADIKPAGGPSAELSSLQVTGLVSITNAVPGRIDQGLLPLASLSGNARLDKNAQTLSDLTVKLAGGAKLVGGARNRSPYHGRLDLQAEGLNLAALHGALRPTQLSGPLTVMLAETGQRLHADLADRAYRVQADATLDPENIVLDHAEVKSGPAELLLQGRLARNQASTYAVKGALKRFDPALFFSTMHIRAPTPGKPLPFKVYQADINSTFEVSGSLNPSLTAIARFDIRDSTYNNLPMQGGGMVHIAQKTVRDSDATLEIAGNRLNVKGSFGRLNDTLAVAIDAPSLDELGFGLSGLLELHGSFAGTFQKPKVTATFSAKNLHVGEHRLASAEGHVQALGLPETGSDATLNLDVKASGYYRGEDRLERLNANVAGSYARHEIQLATAGQLHGQKLDLLLAAHGRLQQGQDGMAWSGTVSRFDHRVFPHVHLAEPASLEAASGRFSLGKTALTVENTDFALARFAFDNGAISSAGRADAVAVAHLLALRQALTGAEPLPLKTDLVLDARWDFKLARQAQGFLQIERRSGDIRGKGQTGDIALGLGKLRLRADFGGSQVTFNAEADASRVGHLQGNGRLGLIPSGALLTITPQSPVSGRIMMDMALQKAGILAGPRISLKGRVNADLNLQGTVGNVAVGGTINGDDLALTLYDQGINLRDGKARLVLHDQVLDIRQAVFHGGKGQLRMTGSIPLDRQRPELTASIVAEKLQLLAKPGSQLMLSGNARITNVDRLSVDGRFVVDNALFNLPETPAPELGDDVVVVRSGESPADRQALAKQRASPFSPAIRLEVDLGRDFRFRGQGADLRMTGLVTITQSPQQPPRAQGTVNVAEGTFEAFGTKLAIERGVLNFQGVMDNPNINILAMRRNQEVAAGVNITGTAKAPRVTLVSEPDVPEEQKLSWLVFGHGGSGAGEGGARTAAQNAALALVNSMAGGKKLAKNLGLDEISLETGASGEQLVTLGKSITDKLTLGYKQGLTTAESAVELTYLLSQHWSVVTRGGQVLGINIRYSKRFD
ncbi:translocation and assembly module TamB [Novimethylophilus kurashikiensis]|uniref:Translocation and assembly module TamB n=1 Tax=Novimethylophilus kurashikiensis TaxID=1825523 RepID=A0A2R5F9K9_9PROT|nr:translocation/assembly module TamB domain-containing protein [Novimethylophilus kurashikiensis]GBG13603.1 translocation and assembly module TamB [Novimethylophilus kurashikiensis]